MEWEKLFANHVFYEELTSRLYRGLLKLSNNKKTNQPIQTWIKNFSKHFSKEDMQVANKHMKRGSASLTIRDMQIKTTMRYQPTAIRMASFKKTENNKC